MFSNSTKYHGIENWMEWDDNPDGPSAYGILAGEPFNIIPVDGRFRVSYYTTDTPHDRPVVEPIRVVTPTYSMAKALVFAACYYKDPRVCFSTALGPDGLDYVMGVNY